MEKNLKNWSKAGMKETLIKLYNNKRSTYIENVLVNSFFLSPLHPKDLRAGTHKCLGNSRGSKLKI